MTADPDAAPRGRAPRKDAVRNDRLVLDAAREVFGRLGPRAGMTDVAHRADVSVGAIYRRFPSKDALLGALIREASAEIDRAASAALDSADPGAGLVEFLEFYGRFVSEKRSYAPLLLEREPDSVAVRKIERKIAALTRAAVASGTFASTVRPADVRELMTALRAIITASTAEGSRAASWKRFLRIHLAGLRAD